ncbi:MAG: hypothetical protein Q8O49_00560 [bacterium]|nr:hypothetical protein [bacterium]
MAERIGIVAFAFGVPATIEANKQIAKVATAIFHEMDAVAIFTQRDVILEPDSARYFPKEDPNNPPPTLRIARGAVEWAEVCGIKQLYVVAAQPHYWRAFRDLQKAVRENRLKIEVCRVSRIDDYLEDSWFCTDSTQERTQSLENWEKREKILRWMPFWIYKIIAS